jgi:ectoine hydroxylase-related dioxygenase (phytanoyl-CoA dioxygenase family)
VNVTVDRRAEHWLEVTLDRLREPGFAIVPGILPGAARERTRLGFERVREGMRREVGAERLDRAGGEGELRLLMKYDPHFYGFLEYPELLALVDRHLAPTAILRFQNGLVIPAGLAAERPAPWHMNFRRVLNGYRAALDIGFAVDDLEEDAGALVVALGSHQQMPTPDPGALEAAARTVPVPAGAMFAFDSTLWHREGGNRSGRDRLLVAHQFVRHFVKPHLDYVRALGQDVVRALPERTRRLLGWESRVPASLAEFYAEPEERVYLPGQE